MLALSAYTAGTVTKAKWVEGEGEWMLSACDVAMQTDPLGSLKQTLRTWHAEVGQQQFSENRARYSCG